MKTSVDETYKILKDSLLSRSSNCLLWFLGRGCYECPFALFHRELLNSSRRTVTCTLSDEIIQSRKNFLSYIIKRFPLLILGEKE